LPALPSRLQRLLIPSLPALPLLFLTVWMVGMEARMLDETRQQIRKDAQYAAADLAEVVAGRLHVQFTELQFAAETLLGPDIDPQHPDPKAVQALRRFQAAHPIVFAFNIQSPDGNTIFWSTAAQPSEPIHLGKQFTPLSLEPDFFLGRGGYAERVGAHVITMRFRMRGPDGQTRYFLGSPARLDVLLAPPGSKVATLPWVFTLRDTRDGNVLGVVQHGEVRFARSTPSSAESSDAVITPVPGYPLAVQASWPADLVRQHYLDAALLRWSVELASLLLLGFATARIARSLRQRDQHIRMLHRMGQMQEFLAQVNQEAALHDDGAAFLQKVCDLAVQRGKLPLAVVAQPDVQGRFRFIAAAGQTAYLDGLVISTDAAEIHGRGPIGTAWREDRPRFNVHLDFAAAVFSPFIRRARSFGLLGISALPLHHRGERFAVLVLYRGDDVAFDPEMRTLLTELAADVSRALDVIELRQTERALLDNAAAGVAVVRDRRILRANATLAAMLGRSLDELIGQSARIVYSTEAEFERFGKAYAALSAEGRLNLPAIRLQRADGHSLLCDCYGQLLADGATSVWTLVDVTARERLQRLYRALTFVADVLLQADDEHAMVDRACEALAQGTFFHAVWIARPDEAGRMQVLASAGEGAAALPSLHLSLDRAEHTPLVVQAWQTGQTVFHNDHRANPRMAPWAEFLREHRWAAALAAPVFRDGVLWATMAFVSPEIGIFDDETVALCTRVAHLLGHGLDELDLRERLREQQRTEAYRARHDALTGLPNRFALEQYLPKAILRAQRRGTQLAVGMIDLDGFKPVNDTYGHDAGDALLRQFAARLRSRLRTSELLVRLGGDEFVLVLEDLDAADAMTPLQAALDRLHGVVETPFDLGQGRQVSVRMSVGVALYPRDGQDAEALLRQADTVMYVAKTRKADHAFWWTAQTVTLQDVQADDQPLPTSGSVAAASVSRFREVVDRTGAMPRG
jgi:diguanylate cyclase (GGDEF)-like protein/PAS domain S-box-containing protein